MFSWLFGPRWWTNLVDTPAVYFVDFGIIGLLGTQQMLLLRRQHRMSSAQRQAACVVVAILLLVTFVRPPVGISNNLYARAPLLAWFVAAPFAAMRATHVGRASWIGVAALVCVFGTAYADVGYLLEGRLFWAVEREHVEALRWVNHNTPRGSLVAIRPGDSQGNVGLWLRRPMVLGGRRLAILFGADPELFGRTEASLERAYQSSSGMEAARRFDDLSDFYFMQADDPATAVPLIIALVKTRIRKRFRLDAVRDIQVLCPMNRGGVGARSLNLELQAALNPAGERKVERFGWTFAPGDKVMQIENDYDKEVYNGDIGYIDDVDPDAGELTARFDGRAVSYGFGELDTVVPAYAATIHKSQGSEYPAVVIPVLTQHYVMLQRNLLYTGVTRGKRLVVLVGQKKAIAIAVRNVSGRRRWSKLAEWLGDKDTGY